MLIYLDANIVQYYADYYVSVRGCIAQPPDRELEIELQALDEIRELSTYAEVQDLCKSGQIWGRLT